MKRNKAIVVVFVVLALALAAFASTRRIALMPHSATVSLTGATTNVDFEAFCNQSPCNISWTLINSGNSVGNLSNSTGPTTTFTATGVGSAELFATDDYGNSAHASITVQN